jgi:hypothetical protein
MNTATENPVLVAEPAAPSVPSQGMFDIVLWAVAIFVGAFLLFQVQPVLTKIILPWFGGGAGIWVTGLVFFQIMYLLGNVYAHVLTRLRAPRTQKIHVGVLALSLLFLPIVPSATWKPAGNENPAVRIFILLAVTVGLPFLLLSATSPLLQTWYVQARRGNWPYRFYALSNAGSLLGLLSYPAVIEPYSTLRHQTLAWSWAYVFFVLVCGWLAFRMRSSFRIIAVSESHSYPSWSTLLLWTALAADASALLLAITNHILQDVASVPLLWVVPLSIYLLTLILCFENERWYRRSFFLRLLAVALAGMTYALAPEFANAGPLLQIPLFCVGLFACCMVCHGELARRKPCPEQLTSFYLTIAAGGALGGVFVGLVAPRIFHDFYELPVALAGCATVTLICVTPAHSRLVATPQRRNALFGSLGALSLIFAFLPYFTGSHRAASTQRNFYGVLRVEDVPASAVEPARRLLLNGMIVHGIEMLNPARRDDAITYYGPESGAALALNAAHKHGSINAGIIGLGAGTIASYGQRADRFTFYEINPLVTQVARSQFDFLRDSRARINVIPGDARISLERQPIQNFDLLLVDAFSGDVIPVHLLTREAFALYFRHLKPDAILAVHVSNKYLDLKPVVQAAAEEFNLQATTITNDADPPNYIYTATWVLLFRPGATPPLADGSDGMPVWSRRDVTVRPWTDDYSSLFKLLR